MQQLARLGEGKAVRRHDGGDEVGRLARHDEAGEALVRGQHHQRHPEVEVGLVGAQLQMPAQRRGEQRLGQVGVLPEHLLVIPAALRVGPAHPPEVLGHAVAVARAHPFPDPGREVRAGDTIGRVVRAGQAGKLAVSFPGRVAQEIDAGIVAGENGGRAAKFFERQTMDLRFTIKAMGNVSPDWPVCKGVPVLAAQ